MEPGLYAGTGDRADTWRMAGAIFWMEIDFYSKYSDRPDLDGHRKQIHSFYRLTGKKRFDFLGFLTVVAGSSLFFALLQPR